MCHGHVTLVNLVCVCVCVAFRLRVARPAPVSPCCCSLSRVGTGLVDMARPDLSDAVLQDLYTWVDQIPLSRPKRSISRDFSDGGLVQRCCCARRDLTGSP